MSGQRDQKMGREIGGWLSTRYTALIYGNVTEKNISLDATKKISRKSR